MIIITDNTNRIIHGILGMILNLFYFIVCCAVVKEFFPDKIVWDIILGFAFATWLLYCVTFGIKWEMKHLEEKMKKIESEEDKLLSSLEGQMSNLHDSIEKHQNNEDKERLKEQLKNKDKK